MIFDRSRKKRKHQGGGNSGQETVNLAEQLSPIDDVLSEVDEALREADQLLVKRDNPIESGRCWC